MSTHSTHSNNSDNTYELLVSLGCTNPRVCLVEYQNNGVTKFNNKQLQTVHVRNVNGEPVVTYPKLVR